MTEDGLIERLLAPLAGGPALGLGDDCAHLPGDLVADGAIVTLDTLVAGVHFFDDDPADLVARKALRVNLSDLAAKGAVPRGYFLSLALPKSIDDGWLERFVGGLADDQRSFSIELWGGDTVSTPGPLSISVTAIGTPTLSPAPLRCNGRPGDTVFVTGTLGDAALGLQLRLDRTLLEGLQESALAHLEDRYLMPRPRIGVIASIGDVHAAMDISDGLLLDLSRLAARSACAAVVERDAIPLSDAARDLIGRKPDLIETVLAGGDDYELLFTVGDAVAETLTREGVVAGVPVTRIGRLLDGDGVRVLDGEGAEMVFQRTGFLHMT